MNVYNQTDKAYNRINNIRLNLSKAVYGEGHEYKDIVVPTKLGDRYIELSEDFNISFYEVIDKKTNQRVDRELNKVPFYHNPKEYELKLIWKIKLEHTTSTLAVNLIEKSVTEEQVFLSILELEGIVDEVLGILAKEKAERDEEHKRFIGRF